MTQPAPPLLLVRDLVVRFPARGGSMVVLDGVDLEVRAGEVFGLIGETGAGKSLSAWASLDLLPAGAWIDAGEVTFNGQVLNGKSDKELRSIRGRYISMIVQNPRSALNPMLAVGKQIGNVYRAHTGGSRSDVRAAVIQSLKDVGIADPERRMGAFPHQLSGGMAQRILIAMALINHPSLVIADEPTTGLDVTIQAEILDLVKDRVLNQGAAMWIITHDLGVIANYTDRAAVMFAGQVVEEGPTATLFERPRHPYTIGLVQAAREESGEVVETALDIAGPPPDLAVRPVGCQFAYRCPWVEPDCRTTTPDLITIGTDRKVRCLVAQRALAEEVT